VTSSSSSSSGGSVGDGVGEAVVEEVGGGSEVVLVGGGSVVVVVVGGCVVVVVGRGVWVDVVVVVVEPEVVVDVVPGWGAAVPGAGDGAGAGVKGAVVGSIAGAGGSVVPRFDWSRPATPSGATVGSGVLKAPGCIMRPLSPSTGGGDGSAAVASVKKGAFGIEAYATPTATSSRHAIPTFRSVDRRTARIHLTPAP
jgi:hypothetical protein